MYDSVYWLLSNQYIVYGEGYLRVEHGSGMGLAHSGEIAEAVFCVAGEQWILADMCRKGLDLWVRFKDDIFRLVNNVQTFRTPS